MADVMLGQEKMESVLQSLKEGQIPTIGWEASSG